MEKKLIEGISRISDAIADSFTDGDDPRSPANVYDALRGIATALKNLGLGNASTDMGAIELLAKEVKEAGEKVSSSISEVADSLLEIAKAISDHSEL